MKTERIKLMKKQYIIPLMEVETVSLSSCLLDGSPANSSTDTHPLPPIGPAPKHRTPVF